MQMACSPNPADNLKRTLQAMEQVVRQGAQIICTQELFTSQYFCQVEDHDCFKLAEAIPAPVYFADAFGGRAALDAWRKDLAAFAREPGFAAWEEETRAERETHGDFPAPARPARQLHVRHVEARHNEDDECRAHQRAHRSLVW